MKLSARKGGGQVVGVNQVGEVAGLEVDQEIGVSGVVWFVGIGEVREEKDLSGCVPLAQQHPAKFGGLTCGLIADCQASGSSWPSGRAGKSFGDFEFFGVCAEAFLKLDPLEEAILFRRDGTHGRVEFRVAFEDPLIECGGASSDCFGPCLVEGIGGLS